MLKVFGFSIQLVTANATLSSLSQKWQPFQILFHEIQTFRLLDVVLTYWGFFFKIK